MSEFNVDTPSFLVGLGTGITGTLAVQRFAKVIADLNADKDTALVRTAAARTMDRGYVKQLVQFAQHHHLAGAQLRLSDIVVEPRFIRPQDLVDIPDEDDLKQIFDVVPQVHDFPTIYESYHIPTISIDDLSRGDGTLLLVGHPGSGRTTALLSIALWSAGYLEFQTPSDAVQNRLDQQESDLSPQERAERVKQRVSLFERGRDRYEKEQAGIVEEEDTREDAGLMNTGDDGEDLSAFRQLAPLYIHVADILPTTGEYGRRIDPAEPLLRGLQQGVGRIVSWRMVTRVYQLLEAGNALVLIDGFDDLPVADRPAIMTWMKRFIELYRDNFIIISMPPTGYGDLMQTGAMPVYLRPFNDTQRFDLARYWGEHWQTFNDAPLTINPDDYEDHDDYYREVQSPLRGRNALETTFGIWSIFHGEHDEDAEQDPPNEGQQLHAYLKRLLPDAESLMTDLRRMAILQLDRGYITAGGLVELAMDESLEALMQWDITPEQAAVEDDVLLAETDATDDDPDDALLAQFYGGGTDESDSMLVDVPHVSETDATIDASEIEAEDAAEEIDEREQAQIRKQQQQLIQVLVEQGVLVAYRDGRYQFRHRLLADYLGAVAVQSAPATVLLAKYHNPNWQHALLYLTQLRDVDFLVAERLKQPLDILHENILSLSDWLRYGGEAVRWREQFFRYLGNLMTAQHQFSLVRERVAAALLNTQHPDTLAIFRRAIRHPNPDVRRLGAIALGALQDTTAINRLADLAIEDSDANICIAATLALGAIGTTNAQEAMIDVLQVTGNNDIRRAVAEAMAADRETGYLTLYDAVRAEEMLIRRAAVFGLGRIPTDWALIELNERYLEDDEFYVRIAAQVVFKGIYEESIRGVSAYPTTIDAPWVKDWGKRQIEMGNIPYDAEDDDIFLKALEDPDTDARIRQLALLTIGQVGDFGRVGKLYTALQDGQESIREAAYRALGDFQQKLGTPLPSPVGKA